MKRNTALFVISFLFIGMIVIPHQTFGFAYRLPTQGAVGLAKGNAVTTDLNEPSSVFYNPAATAYSEGVQFTMGSNLITSKTSHEFGAVDEHSERKTYYTPNAFATFNMKEIGFENVTIGVGTASPFGLGMVYKTKSPIAPVVQKAELKVVDYLLTAGVKVYEKLSLGAGLNLTYSEVELQRQIDFGSLAGAPRALDGNAEFRGYDLEPGFNVSLLFRPMEHHFISATFRAQQLTRFEGKGRVRGIPGFTGLPPVLKGDATLRLNYPAILQGGYGVEIGKLKLEFLLDWARWQNLNAFEISNDNPLIGDLIYPADFKNVFTYNASAEYALTDWLDLYLGFIWTETPIPDHTFNAVIPDSDRFGLSCGLGFKIEQLQIDTGFQWVHFEGRNVGNDVGLLQGGDVDGNYDTDAFVVGMNATLRF